MRAMGAKVKAAAHLRRASGELGQVNGQAGMTGNGAALSAAAVAEEGVEDEKRPEGHQRTAVVGRCVDAGELAELDLDAIEGKRGTVVTKELTGDILDLMQNGCPRKKRRR
jgi:hypothetical protein